MVCYKTYFIFQCICSLVFSAESPKPHIVFMLVDDWGWHDVGFHGMTDIPTPNLDALAYNGIILNNYYTYHLCTPSRASLLSGRLATAIGLQHYVIISGQPLGLKIDLKLLPQFLNDLGYESHMVGKWHLGFHKKSYTPSQRGFKSHYGFWNGNSDFFEHTSSVEKGASGYSGVPPCDTRQKLLFLGHNFMDGSKRVNKPGHYLTFEYTSRSVEIIKNHNVSKPLFLYLAHHGVHRGNFLIPIRGPENLTKLFTNLDGNSERKNFAGALTAIDDSLGEVMEALENKNMLEDTLIVVTADNGSPLPGKIDYNGGSNYPLRGGKATLWEGGLRGNAFLWNGRLKERSFVYDGLMHIVDWIPTIYAAAGGEEDIVRQHGLHGLNLWEAITQNKTSPRTQILLNSDGDVKAYRRGDYKIISGEEFPRANSVSPGRGHPPPGLPTTGSKTEQVLRRIYGPLVTVSGTPIEVNCGKPSGLHCNPMEEPCLFNVKDDPCELRNLAKELPETLQCLQREMLSIPIVKPNFPKVDYASNPDFYGGYWTPWLDNPRPLNAAEEC